MTVIVACPNCQRQLQTPEDLFGQTVQCPACRYMFEVQPPPYKKPEPLPAFPVPAATEKSPPWQKGQPDPGPAYDAQDEPPHGRRSEDDAHAEERRDDFPRRTPVRPHRASVVLLLGILSICCIGTPITGIIAWILGNADIQAMRRGAMDQSGLSQTQTGKALGMLSTVLFCLGTAGCCLVSVFSGPGRMRPGRRRF